MRKEITILFGAMGVGLGAMALSVFAPSSKDPVMKTVESGAASTNIYNDDTYKKGAAENSPLNSCIAKVLKDHTALAGRTVTASSLQLPDGHVMDVFRAMAGEGASLHGVAVSVYRDLDGPDTLQIENIANNPADMEDQVSVQIYADKDNLGDPGTVNRNYGAAGPAAISSMEYLANGIQDRIMRCMRQQALTR